MFHIFTELKSVNMCNGSSLHYNSINKLENTLYKFNNLLSHFMYNFLSLLKVVLEDIFKVF